MIGVSSRPLVALPLEYKSRACQKIENHVAMITLFYMHYNFSRVHQTLRVTPAMEAGISQHVWSIQEIIMLIDKAVTSIAA